ncbi:hypothetical protein Pmani_000846 [Petrolisthes manimaculis]|uniref:BHLH domain-containing protein n=1 Tax=Petrolisthes manimaculis TaxID=1843537 RepID=A0AAE1QLY3_9EUCA|nr:hypothetical protein Pmani_000846 [Petrolisthes manimaculis]
MPRKRRDGVEGGRGGRPVQRNAANARERARMRILSRAFSRLKTTLPWVPADTKLSKLDTLRLATSYIAHLRSLLQDHPQPPAPPPLALTWPFSFPRGGGEGGGGREGSKEVICCGRERDDGMGDATTTTTTTTTTTSTTTILNQQTDRYYNDEFQDYDYYSPDLLHLS